MRLPHRTFEDALDRAQFKANETGAIWYVNRLASSGMAYESSPVPITNTSFGGSTVKAVPPNGMAHTTKWRR